ncbi:TIR domain-containing protein [Halarcobacter sp.]|uniref:TIR domain-containing protein n=1 Tax=Halarcobacter sp. TaxID=2321133 RepID=UPI003A9422B3
MSNIFKVFVSYAHEDASYKDDLLKHCALLIENEKINIWTDDQIRAGNKFNDKIKKEVENCDVAILLVSSTYWSKPYINDTELPLILEHEENRKIIVIPILINGERKIKYSKLSGRTLVPIESNKLKAIDNFDDKEKAWDIIFDEIDKSLEEYEKKLEQIKIELSEESIEKEKNDILKICIYTTSPLNSNIYYDFERIKYPFKKFDIELFHKVLNEDELIDSYEFDYCLIFTKSNEDKIIIEDEYFMQKSISLEELSEMIDNSKAKIFLDKTIVYSDFDIKVVDSDNMLKKVLATLIHKEFKFKKGRYKVNSLDTNLPELIDKKNLINFVGRKTDIENLVKKVLSIKNENKILTIKGAGGLGKTTTISKVVVEIAQKGKFEDGIKFVPCEYIKDYGEFENVISFAFDMNNAINFKIQLKEQISKDEQRLIILDNVETILHLNDRNEIKEFIKFISDYATIVITSREKIDEEFEEVYELRELTTDEAQELFLKLYPMKNYDEKFLRSEILENMLNKNPLAIKLVTKNLPKGKELRYLKKELDESFFDITSTDIEKIFENESDLNIERTKSLFQSINYSYSKLTEKEKLALELLSLFPDGMDFENFKKFYNQKPERGMKKGEKKKKLVEISDIKNDIFSDKDLISLSNKSMIVTNNQFINLQSIIGRFADYKFNHKDKEEKIEFYKRAYYYNSFVKYLISDKNNFSYSKRARIFDANKNNFLKSFTYICHLELNYEKYDYISDICDEFSLNASPNNSIFEKLNIIEKEFIKDDTNQHFFKILNLSLQYFYGDFENVFNTIKKEYPLNVICEKYINYSKIELIYIDALITIYGMEGEQYKVVKTFLTEQWFSMETFELGEYLVLDKYFLKRKSYSNFTLFEFQLNNNLLKISELKKYVTSLHKTQLIDKVQSTYTLLKADKSEVKLKDIKKLIISNPFTDGLKTLMIAIKDDENSSKDMYEEAIKKLYHIRYYHVEAILLYCVYLKDIQDSDYEKWLLNGKELAQKHYYRYLLHRFNCIESGINTLYDERDHPLTEPLDFTEVIKQYNL